MASLKGQVSQAFVPQSNENDLNRTSSSKKSSSSQPLSARGASSSRIQLPPTNRKMSNDEMSVISTHDGPFSRAQPQGSLSRSRSFNNNSSMNPSPSPPTNTLDETTLLRAYRAHLEQVLRKDAPFFTDIKIPNYASIDDVLKSNEVDDFICKYKNFIVYHYFSNFYLKMNVFDQN